MRASRARLAARFDLRLCADVDAHLHVVVEHLRPDVRVVLGHGPSHLPAARRGRMGREGTGERVLGGVAARLTGLVGKWARPHKPR